MSLWAIADIHGSRRDPATGLPSKPMDVFGHRWENHLGRLEAAWREAVGPCDTVIVAGDIDWALQLGDAMETLELLAALPGRKILLRGNHDYWWSSKTTNRVRAALPAGLVALHNDAIYAEGFNVCGTKGSPVAGGADWTPHDEKLLNRERQRLKMSLARRDPAFPTVVAIHYPPFYPSARDGGYRPDLEGAGVEAVVYGHLHGEAAGAGPRGCIAGIQYTLVAADAIDFRPVLLGDDGVLRMNCEDQKEGAMSENKLPLDDLGELAEEEISTKLRELGDEEQAREMYDLPSESDAQLAERQKENQKR